MKSNVFPILLVVLALVACATPRTDSKSVAIVDKQSAIEAICNAETEYAVSLNLLIALRSDNRLTDDQYRRAEMPRIVATSSLDAALLALKHGYYSRAAFYAGIASQEADKMRMVIEPKETWYGDDSN